LSALRSFLNVRLTDAYRQVGIYAARISGERIPANCPTAKALALTVRDKLLAVADKVIE